jgi:hypothetical protein
MPVHGLCVCHPPACCHKLTVALKQNPLMFCDDTNSVFCCTSYREQVSYSIRDVPHIFQVAWAPLALYQYLDINATRPTSQYRSFICQRYIDWSLKPCTLQSTACLQSCDAMHQICIPTYPQVSCCLLLLPKMLNLWYRPLTMYPCYLSPLIYSFELSVSDSSFSDG